MTRREPRGPWLRALAAAALCSALLAIGHRPFGIAPAEAQAPSGAVAGSLFRLYGGYPAAGVMVTLWSPALGRSYPSYSDQRGWFALFRIPPGPYTLEVWLGPGRPPINVAINVAPGSQLQVPPVAVP